MFVLRVLSSLQGSLVTPLQGCFPLLSFLCGCFSVVCRLCLQSLHHDLRGRQPFVFQVCLLLSELPLGLSSKPPFLPASFGLSSWLCHPCSLPCLLNCCICRSMLAGVPALVDMPSKTRVPCTRKFRTTRHIYIPGLHLRRQCPLTYTMSSQRTSPSNLMRRTFTPIEKL